MSVEATNMVLGAGRIFIRRSGEANGRWRMIGEIRDEAVFTYTPETAEQKVANSLGVVARRKVSEAAMLKATVADFKTVELRFALGITLSTTQLTGTNDMRISQEVTFGSTTTSKTLSRTALSTTAIQITSLDRATDYVKGTDYTASTTKVKPITAGFANTTRMVHYTKRLTTTQNWRVGGNINFETFNIIFVHPQPNKKVIAVLFHKCTIDGDMAINFNEKEFTSREITFKALEDTTRAKGDRLFRIFREP